MKLFLSLLLLPLADAKAGVAASGKPKQPVATDISSAKAKQMEEDSKDNIYQHHPEAADARIIDGVDAVEGRYSYIVSLQQIHANMDHFCGGSLIAPDMFLTAAHCAELPGDMAVRVDPHNLKIPVEGSELFPVLERVIHPDYVRSTLTADFAVYKFDGISTRTPVHLNNDAPIPSDGQQVRVVGWGTTSPYRSSQPDILQVFDSAVYISNDECAQILGGNSLTPDNMCTIEASGGGPCYGDSGGPLIIPGADADEDVQLGLVSWGIDCDSPTDPTVYGRISWGYEFIRENVCRMSADPPSSFSCELLPTAMPTSSPAPTAESVDILLQLFMDGDPYEIGWRLETLDGLVLYEKLSGSYDSSRSAFLEVLSVTPENRYLLVLTDSYGDGNFGPIAVQVFLGNAVDSTQLLASSDFPRQQEQNVPIFVSSEGLRSAAPIYTSRPQALEPSAAPTHTNVPTLGGLINVTVFIRFDSRPIHTSWALRSTDYDLVAQGGPYGPFIGHNITQVVAVEPDQTYIFTIYDQYYDGICCEYGDGEAYVYLANEAPSIKTDNAVVHDDGRFRFARDHRFVTSEDAIIDFTMTPTMIPTTSMMPTRTPSAMPTRTPSATPTSRAPSPVQPNVPISIVIWFDDYPGELGWRLQKKGETIMHIPPGTYNNRMRFKRVQTVLDVTGNDMYTMQFYDSEGDGYCCGYGRGNITVWTVSETSEDRMLVADSGGSLSFESSEFFVPFVPRTTTFPSSTPAISGTGFDGSGDDSPEVLVILDGPTDWPTSDVTQSVGVGTGPRSSSSSFTSVSTGLVLVLLGLIM